MKKYFNAILNEVSEIDLVIYFFDHKVAENQPDKIFKVKIDIKTGLTTEQATQMAKDLDFKGKKIAIVSLTLLCNSFVEAEFLIVFI